MKRKITDTKGLLKAIDEAGLALAYGTGDHRHVQYKGRKVATISVTNSQDPRTYLNYVRAIKQHCGIDIRGANLGRGAHRRERAEAKVAEPAAPQAPPAPAQPPVVYDYSQPTRTPIWGRAARAKLQRAIGEARSRIEPHVSVPLVEAEHIFASYEHMLRVLEELTKRSEPERMAIRLLEER